MEWYNLILKAIADEDDILGREKGEALWSERFSEDDLEEIKSTLGASIFSAMYQQTPIESEDSYFETKKVKYFNNEEDEIINDYYVKDNFIFLSVDPAASVSQKADYTAIAVCGKNSAEDLFVYEMIRCKIKAGEHEELIDRIAKKYNTNYVIIEKNSYQASIPNNLEKMGYNILSYQSIENKKARALVLANLINRGKLYLKSQSNWLNDLLIEMDEFDNGQHDDQVDALAFAAIVESVSKNGRIVSMKIVKKTLKEKINSFG